MEDIDREHFESILAGEKAIFMVGKKPFGKSTLAEKLRAQEGFRVYDENDSYEGKIDGTTWEKEFLIRWKLILKMVRESFYVLKA